jgi:AP-5 complex subunit mu-1
MVGMATTPSIRGCSIRALWIFNQTFNLVFSRRFVTVERLWKQACEQRKLEGPVYCSVPFDAQVAESFVASKLAKERRDDAGEGEALVDDPIMRYVMSLEVEEGRLWPVVEHRRSGCFILVLPMVEPHQMAAFEELCTRSGCGGATSDLGLSKLLLDMPCVTGALAVGQALGDVLSGDLVEPELFAASTATMGSFLDSLTGGMGVGISGIAARAKPVAVPVAAAANAVAAAAATATSAITGGGRATLKSSEKDALRSFITSAMPFGTPLDVNSVNLAAVKSNGFTSLDVPVAEQRQPMWKPYLYRGKQRMAFAVHEVVTAALYDRDDVQDSISLAGEVLCRLDLEGLPEVSLQLLTPASSTIDSLTFHLCAQAPEQGANKQGVTFTPPLGNFVLARYTAIPKTINPPLQGFYQLSMVSETEGAFLIRMRVMAGYKNSSMVMEQCSLSVPFPRRKIVGVEGVPSVGTVSQTDHSIEWKIVLGRVLPKGTEVTYPGTVKFAPSTSRQTKSESQGDAFRLDDSDTEVDLSQENESFKGERGEATPLPADMEEPLCWEAYSFAKASIKVTGGSMSGISIDPKAVSVYPTVKTACEFSSQVLSGEYIFWNSLGRYPQAVPALTNEIQG